MLLFENELNIIKIIIKKLNIFYLLIKLKIIIHFIFILKSKY